MVSDEYAAGLFDGEGWITLKSRNDYGAYRLQIGMNQACHNDQVVREMCEKYGGRLRHKKTPNEKSSDQTVWVLGHRDDQLVFFRSIEPHAIIKSRQIEVAMMYLQTVYGPGPQQDEFDYYIRDVCKRAMTYANRRGPR